MKNKIRLAIIGLALVAGVINSGAQSSTNIPNLIPPPSFSEVTNSVSADAAKLATDIWGDFLTLKPFTTNGEATVFAGGGINTANKRPVGIVGVAFPVSSMAAIGAVGGYENNSWFEGGLNAQLGTTNNVPVVGPVVSVVGDGAVYNFRQHEPANYAFTAFSKEWSINKKFYAGGSAVVANTSDVPGVDALLVASVGFHW